ncbi:SDR family oxidoreductase [Salipaludibacillus agaradhaerens]|uniref:SDR family oxidoreductase n=1 Tax=Salipaludibacillus agaradhaerens TaxID=76935 RepID=A0A9Q4G175_SALAG|nr:SDR family oxidoreductase [Salipaludibacillus agaradhaerens]MCR6098747.1 SDR family oxidoreductase [Salipaludibacillus agaradhaerens]MCR6115754.1 SDR family oxidoreductase [Salipaludibacillus agaradhaerens]
MKVALVTGTNSGFGLLICLELLKAGFHVVATMRRKENSGELLQRVEALELQAYLDVKTMDVTNHNHISSVKQEVEKTYGHVDVLVNNAGYCQGGFLEDVSLTEWRAQFDVNVDGVFRVTQAFLPLLKASASARIINISSVSGLFGFPGLSPYCSSKFALEGLSESLRLELLPDNIYVSLVEPGSYKTRIWKKSLAHIEAGKMNDTPFKRTVLKEAERSASTEADPVDVARLTASIACAKKPKFRYPIGKGVKQLFHIKKYVPQSWIEKVVMRKLR